MNEVHGTENGPKLLSSNIPADCRIIILSYLTPTELYRNFAYCSKLCHEDSTSSELPHTKWGEFRVSTKQIENNGSIGQAECLADEDAEKEINMESLIQLILHESFQRAWQRSRSYMKIVGLEQQYNLGLVSAKADDISFEEMQGLTSDISFEGVTSLDLSVLSIDASGDDDGEANGSGHHATTKRVLPRCLPWLLSTILPGLLEVDLSNLHGAPNDGDYISELSLFNSINCPNIQKVTWNNRAGGCYFLRGKDMKSLDHLKELYVDNILCDWRYDKLFAPLITQFFQEDSIIQRFFFFACNKSLERVSLRGGRYINMGSSEKKDFPQWALIRFVRRTPTLRYFRSNLTKENIELLSMERPEIEFCN